MSYINFKMMYSKGLSTDDYITLQMILQQEATFLKEKEDLFPKYEGFGFVQYIKGKGELSERIRLTKEGLSILKQIATPNLTDEVAVLSNSVIEMYETQQKPVGNTFTVQDRLLWFLSETGFTTDSIYQTVEEYLQTSGEYTMSLENLFWRPTSKAFSVHKKLEESKLYDIMCAKYKINKFFFTKKRGVSVEWMFDVSKLQLPKKMDKEFYFTGSYEGDFKHILEMKKQLIKKAREI